MNSILWTLPKKNPLVVPPDVILHLGGSIEIVFTLEHEEGGQIPMSIFFEGVMAYKCSYVHACDPAMIDQAYNKLVSISESDWLSAIHKLNPSDSKLADSLKHFVIYFDDEACYEAIGMSATVRDKANTS